MNESLTLYNKDCDLVSVLLDNVTYPRVKDYYFAQLSATLAPMVGGACIIRGVAMTDEARVMTAEALADIVRETYPKLTIPEIGKAIKQGSYGIYGEVYGINAASLFRMIKGYAESEERKELVMAANAARAKQKQSNAEWLAQHPDYKVSTFSQQSTLYTQ